MKRQDLAALGGALVLVIFVAVFSSNGLLYEYSERSIESTTSPADSGHASGARSILASLAAKARQHKASTASSTRSTPADKKDKPARSSEDLTLSLSKLNKALVNVICDIHTPAGEFLTSGSGVIIDPRGIILTNAHVAQFLLLTKGPATTRCSIRTGSPASASYDAQLIYISDPWIRAHPGTALSGSPSGTGENDFALLMISGSRTDTPLPPSFPFMPLTETTLAIGREAVLASYGAQGLNAEQVRRSLYPTLAFASIKDVFAFRQTFDLTAIDLIALGANSAAQAGSSGGGVADGKGQLAGLITTSKPGSNVSAITAGHIKRSFRADTGTELARYLSDRTGTELIQDFRGRAAELTDVLQ